MFRTKTLAILALMLFTLATPVMAAHADDEVESVGTASVQDDQSSSDSIAISLTGIPKASDGTSYNAYLESGDGSNTLNLGTGSVELPVVHGVIQSTGSLVITYDSSSAGYDGSNLLGSFSRVKITEEPSGTVVYSDALPGGAVSEIKALLDDVVALNSAIDAAISSANSASSASDTAGINDGINLVVSAVDNIVDLSGQVNAHAVAAGEAAPDESGISDNVSGIEAITSNISAWSTSAKKTAEEDILPQSSSAVAQIFVANVINQLSAARNGWDADNSGAISATAGEGGGAQAYAVGQSMASFTLTASELPVGEEAPETVVEASASEAHLLGSLGLPSVGEKILSNLMAISVLFGVLLLAGGTTLMSRSKQSK